MKTLLSLLLSIIAAIGARAADWNTETIRCGNLSYGDNQTSVCFADAFLKEVAKETGLNVSPAFEKIKLAGHEVFNTPFCIFTGEGDFKLTEAERANLKRYLENGGFILASPGCSDEEWNKAFLRELAIALPGSKTSTIPFSHELFSTVNKITKLNVKGGSTAMLQGVFINGRLALVYSPEGLNDVANAQGCCCCGGAEIREARQVNVNSLAYALLH